MNEPHKQDGPEEPSDAPSKADYAALGIGCLVAIIIFAAALYVGLTRG